MGLDNIQQLDDIGMIQLSKERDLANNIARHSSFRSGICEWNPFDGHYIASVSLFPLYTIPYAP